jgi:hypothetical protein
MGAFETLSGREGFRPIRIKLKAQRSEKLAEGFPPFENALHVGLGKKIRGGSGIEFILGIDQKHRGCGSSEERDFKEVKRAVSWVVWIQINSGNGDLRTGNPLQSLKHGGGGQRLVSSLFLDPGSELKIGVNEKNLTHTPIIIISLQFARKVNFLQSFHFINAANHGREDPL